MLNSHIISRLKLRNLNYSEDFLLGISQKCRVDTAVLLKSPEKKVFVRDEEESNGDLVILIVRNGRPITIMFRRSNQSLNKFALNVEEIHYEELPVYYSKDRVTK